jgi:2-amino-4-hydroxy-6-hydroxymethyldihydropteridine diphosphokinase
MVAEMDKRNNKVVLSLGGNVGDVKSVFLKSIELLETRLGRVGLVSPIYKTKAWGVESQSDFLNQVILINTKFSPKEVLKVCLDMELELGRVRREKWGERVVDIDLLFYNDDVIDSEELTIPHPYIHERNFVLFPLVDIIPKYKHPLLHQSMSELKKKCNDKLKVIKCLG